MTLSEAQQEDCADMCEQHVEELVAPWEGRPRFSSQTVNYTLGGKRLDLLRQVVPGLAHLGVLWNPAHPATPLDFKESEEAARVLGLHVVSL